VRESVCVPARAYVRVCACVSACVGALMLKCVCVCVCESKHALHSARGLIVVTLKACKKKQKQVKAQD